MEEVRKLDAPAEFGMEGHYRLSLYCHLRQAGQTVHVINPLQSDALRSMFIRQTKNDTIDALIVAEVIRFGRYCETQVAPENIVALRELCRQRFFVVDTASDFKRKIIALLDITQRLKKCWRSTLKADLLNKASRGRFGLDKVNQIQQTAKNSFGIVLASSSFSLIIRQYLEQLKSFESSIAAFDAVIFSEIGGDIKKFSSVPKFVAYAGLYRKSRQSGESKTDGRMSKRGSPYLRRAVWLAASVAAFKDHLTVIGHVCHKMLAIIKPYLPASTS